MKKALALSALPLVLLFAAAFQSPNSILEQLKVIQSQNSSLQSEISDLKAQVASTVPRKYYMTRDRYDGAHALTACAAGYHMASLWEIHETSNLRYDTERGLTRGDSGFGPPNSFSGWIRTGYQSSALSLQGAGNCNAWTSAISTDRGTFAGLQSNWSPPPAVITNLWFAGVLNCNTEVNVWCVQD